MVRLLLAAALVHLLFAIWPGMDLAVSRLFYRPTEGFPLARSGLLKAMRYAFWGVTILAFAAALAGIFMAIVLGRKARVQGRVWSFAALALALGPGLLVDRIVKPLWSRARPEALHEFGGTRDFSPPFEIVSECRQNCSFVSGEAAGAVMLALVIALLGRHLVPPERRLKALGALAFCSAAASGLRIAMGRHFLSDVVFAAFLMALLALWLYRRLGIATARHSLTPQNLRADLGALKRAVSSSAPGPVSRPE